MNLAEVVIRLSKLQQLQLLDCHGLSAAQLEHSIFKQYLHQQVPQHDNTSRSSSLLPAVSSAWSALPAVHVSQGGSSAADWTRLPVLWLPHESGRGVGDGCKTRDWDADVGAAEQGDGHAAQVFGPHPPPAEHPAALMHQGLPAVGPDGVLMHLPLGWQVA